LHCATICDREEFSSCADATPPQAANVIMIEACRLKYRNMGSKPLQTNVQTPTAGLTALRRPGIDFASVLRRLSRFFGKWSPFNNHPSQVMSGVDARSRNVPGRFKGLSASSEDSGTAPVEVVDGR
jgi:hypothetical protein